MSTLPLTMGTRVRVNDGRGPNFEGLVGTVIPPYSRPLPDGFDTVVVLDGGPWPLNFHHDNLDTDGPFAVGQRVMTLHEGVGRVGTVASYHLGCDAVRVVLDMYAEGSHPLWFDVSDVSAVDE